ncbi:MAG: hypothetical protein HXX08_14620 [Chloroflexi bacterium]|uniref:Uncharacterized protein n=1 Tax=Candidatus Chlorohelix allophototropha TaxID=3003348 RepID=A0A8T7M4Q9_9CHLR|nr:hypothetical protein [Chloroflexota bacterium]WJW70405.1 hypothetical protein OZ401_004982 [Chloroflexota bacterium L227-S17]
MHMVRDLSAWSPERGMPWDPVKTDLLQRFSSSLFENNRDELFLIAANDGQLMEAWRRLDPSKYMTQAQEVLETLLVEDHQEQSGVALRLFNLSRHHSADLFERALQCFLEAPGWEICRSLESGSSEFFGSECPIRHNLELLATPLVQNRLQDLFSLCDYNQYHLPIRQILLLLVNAVLGHPDAKDQLMKANDVPNIIRKGTVAKASLYNNLLGGNLSDTRRESILVFDALNRFGIGFETSNRIDNILIFGDTDELLQPYFNQYINTDKFYGADPSYAAAQREYIEGTDEDEERSSRFLRMLVSQRRGLFFKIPHSEAADMHLWDLTVFCFAGEYLEQVVSALEMGKRVARTILARLVRGLNRVFTGMLVSDDRDLLLATSLALSQGKVSRLLEERISVEPRRGERVDIILREDGTVPLLEVAFSREISCTFPLYLTRYEFLSRVAQGALPSSFSKECYEDVLAFKSQLLTALTKRQIHDGEEQNDASLAFRLLEVEETGKVTVQNLEIREM